MRGRGGTSGHHLNWRRGPPWPRIRSRPLTGWDVLDGTQDMYIWWDQAGQSLKVPSLGAHLSLTHPVPEVLCDLLLATCVNITVGTHSFLGA